MKLQNSQTQLAAASGRRHWILGSAFAAGGVLLGAKTALAGGDNEISHSAEAIHQEMAFKADPKRIYEALLDARQFQKVELLSDAGQSLDLAGKPARIDRRAGGTLSLFWRPHRGHAD